MIHICVIYAPVDVHQERHLPHSHLPAGLHLSLSRPTLHTCVNAQVFIKSGISPTATYLPACIHPKHTGAPRRDMDSASAEAEAVM